MDGIGGAHEGRRDAHGQGAPHPADLLEVGIQVEELGDADADGGRKELTEYHVARLRQRGLNGVVLEDCRGAHAANDDGRAPGSECLDMEHGLDDQNAREGAQKSPEPNQRAWDGVPMLSVVTEEP